MNDVLVLVHGAFHGPWCWQPTIDALATADLECFAIDLNRGGLEADRKALQEVVDARRADGQRVHAIGHSLGCSSVAALDPASLSSAIFLAGTVLGGEGFPSARGSIAPGFLDALEAQEDGRGFISRAAARDAFYHTCPTDRAEWALDRLRPTFVYGPPRPAHDFFDQVPTTFIACREDQVIPFTYAGPLAEAMPRSAILDGDHSPMIGCPEALARLIEEAIAAAD